MTDESPPIGHNQPPSPIERGDALVATCNAWMEKVGKIADAEQAGRAQALVDQLRLEIEAIEGEWKKEREPFDVEIAMLRGKYRPRLELLGISLDMMKRLAQGWLDAEKMRLDHEASERRRLAAEAEAAALKARQDAARAGATVQAEAAARELETAAKQAKALASKPVERPQIKGEFSARAMTLHGRWRAEITDEKTALKHFAKHAAIREAALAAIVKVASEDARRLKNEAAAPPGCRFVRGEKAV